MSEPDSVEAAETTTGRTASVDRRFTFFLFALIFLFFVYLPLTPPLPVEPFDLMVYALLLSAVYAVSGQRRSFIIAVVLAIPSFVIISLVDLQDPQSTLAAIVAIAAVMIFVAYVTWVLMRRVFSEGTVTLHVISGAFCIYLLLGFLWTMAYGMVEVVAPGSFRLSSPDGALDPGRLTTDTIATLHYFSFITITTAGYGDVTPVNSVARSLAVLESVTNQIFLAVMVASLVGRYTAQFLSRDNAG